MGRTERLFLAGLAVAEVGAIEDEVGIDERAGRFVTDGIGEASPEELGDVFVQGIVLSGALGSELEGNGLQAGVEEGAAEEKEGIDCEIGRFHSVYASPVADTRACQVHGLAWLGLRMDSIGLFSWAEQLYHRWME